VGAAGKLSSKIYLFSDFSELPYKAPGVPYNIGRKSPKFKVFTQGASEYCVAVRTLSENVFLHERIHLTNHNAE
jgi:hypothetical protein